MTGRKLSESTIEKIKNSNTKYTVLQLDIDGNIINKFYGCIEIDKYIGTTKENINMCCNGKRKTTKGYVFKECFPIEKSFTNYWLNTFHIMLSFIMVSKSYYYFIDQVY